MSRLAVDRVLELLRSGELTTRYADLIDVRPHPSGDLVILNYTRECQYGRHWDEVTRACRGLIIDTRAWRVAAWPLPKFFNIGECPETQPDALPIEPFQVFEKLDGSLGISYRTPEGTALASRGSFTSDQAERGTALLRRLPGSRDLPEHVTFLFEIIYEANRSVVKYPFESVVLLAAMDRETGLELPWAEVAAWGERLGCPLPRVYPFGSLGEVVSSRSLLPSDREGYVVRFASGLRVKLKGEAYLALHKVVWGLSERRVGEALVQGRYLELLSEVPEEFRPEVEAMAQGFQDRARVLESQVRTLYAQAPTGGDRKTFALWVQAQVPRPLRGALFSLRDEHLPNWFALLEKVEEDPK